MSDRKPRCSLISREIGEPVAGTASTVTRWILLEHPAAWAADALLSGGVPSGVAAFLDGLWSEHRIRVVLVRRRYHEVAGGFRCFAIWTGAVGPFVERTKVRDVRELLDVDFSPLARGRSVGLDARRDPVFIVCTHGAHDTCCGLYGRPVADALAEWWPKETWECSHIGGDRFAGNVVCFPRGDYFGRLDRSTAPTTIAGYLDGRIDLDHYRGRTCFPFAVQAAEAWVRDQLLADGLDAVRPLEWSGDTVTFELDDGRRVRTTVVVGHHEEPRYLTCAQRALVRPPTFEVSWRDR